MFQLWFCMPPEKKTAIPSSDFEVGGGSNFKKKRGNRGERKFHITLLITFQPIVVSVIFR